MRWSGLPAPATMAVQIARAGNSVSAEHLVAVLEALASQGCLKLHCACLTGNGLDPVATLISALGHHKAAHWRALQERSISGSLW